MITKRKALDDWRSITQSDLQEAVESILDSPPTARTVRDRRTGSIGAVTADLGTMLGDRDKVERRLYVKVTEPAAWHKKGDPVIWRDPISLS